MASESRIRLRRWQERQTYKYKFNMSRLWASAYTSRFIDRYRNLSDKIHRLPTTGQRAALIAHVFYPELLGEIIDCYRRFPTDAHLLITTPENKASSIRAALPRDINATILPCLNRGRDIAPFLSALNAGQFDKYDVVLKLHTKRADHIREGALHRRLMYASLAGSRRQVQAILDCFAEKPCFGIAAERMMWCDHKRYWQANQEMVGRLAGCMKAKAERNPCFFRGSMFWFRPAALERLRKLAICTDDFEPEAGQIDGALQHAIERIFSIVAWADGYRTVDMSGRVLFGSDDVIDESVYVRHIAIRKSFERTKEWR